MSNEKDLSNEEYLRSNDNFQRLPHRMQELILKSTNASSDFRAFFANGGEVVPDPEEGLASYRSEPMRRIHINSQHYRLAQSGTNGDYISERLFSIVAHEIGHDKDRNTRFPSNISAEEYVQYRSLKEAKAVFNSFPIFSDLRNTEPTFRPHWNAVGYDSMGVRWPALYNSWRDGRIEDEAAIDEIAKVVPDYPYTRDDGIGDQFKTWRDVYLHEYKQTRDNKQTHSPEAVDQHADPQATAWDRNHPDHAMHQDIRRRLVDLFQGQGITIEGERLERLAAGVMADARHGQVSRVDAMFFSVDQATGKVKPDGNVFTQEAFQGDLRHPACPWSATNVPQAFETPVEDSYKRFEASTQHQAQVWERFLTQEQELSQGRGMHRSL